jgi:hypothetical protein
MSFPDAPPAGAARDKHARPAAQTPILIGAARGLHAAQPEHASAGACAAVLHAGMIATVLYHLPTTSFARAARICSKQMMLFDRNQR